MPIETGEIKQSQQIFYYLLCNRELKEEEERELYKVYVENDTVRNLLKNQAEIARCGIARFGSVIYLIPQVDNEILGYSKSQLKNALCRSGATDKDYYLSQFAVITLLVEFYDANGSTSKARDYLKVGELLNRISERLKEGADHEEEQEGTGNGLDFTSMLEAFEALRSEEKGSRSKTTKEGFLYTVLMFLQKQGLIDYIEADEMIKTTEKLDHFMDFNLLNKNNYNRVLSVLGVKDHE